MTRNLIVLALGIVAIPDAMATCLLESGILKPQTIGSHQITLRADAPADASTPIASYDSDALGNILVYGCDNGTEYGKDTLILSGQNTTTKIFDTEIPGIGVKLTWYNGSAWGQFPSSTNIKWANDRGTMSISGASLFRAEFYKMTDNVSLNNKGGDIVLSPNLYAYNYFNSNGISNAYTTLNIGPITIVSTPVCTVDSPKIVDFNQVTPNALKAEVQRDLNFFINCKTDYGTYAAKAMMTAQDVSTDASYIKVTDAGNNKDRLGIRITDGNSQAVKLDGDTGEQKLSVASGANAQFNWKATLFSTSTEAPVVGQFNAKAEIVFNIE